MTDCLFCKMVSGDIKPDVVHETDSVLAFRDINPQAPTHVLIIPKQHISSINDLQENDQITVGKLYSAAKHIAAEEGIDNAGYRVVMNCGEDGGQTVWHMHLHLLGGRRMTWPPG
jgi:histidine triad (HIT) family protein